MLIFARAQGSHKLRAPKAYTGVHHSWPLESRIPLTSTYSAKRMWPILVHCRRAWLDCSPVLRSSSWRETATNDSKKLCRTFRVIVALLHSVLSIPLIFQ